MKTCGEMGRPTFLPVATASSRAGVVEMPCCGMQKSGVAVWGDAWRRRSGTAGRAALSAGTRMCIVGVRKLPRRRDAVRRPPSIVWLYKTVGATMMRLWCLAARLNTEHEEHIYRIAVDYFVE
jgi:hypothetical protein